MLGAVNAAAWAGIPVGGLAGRRARRGGRAAARPWPSAAAVYFATTLAPFVFPAWRGMDEPADRKEELAATAAR